MSRNAYLLAAAGLMFVAGCSPAAPRPNPKARFRGVTIKIVVADIPDVASWLSEQHGEWSAQTGGQVELLNLEAAGSSAVEAARTSTATRTRGPDGDILVYRTNEMGSIVVPGAVVKLPKHVLESPAFEAKDIGPAIHDQLIAWDRQAQAFPITAEALVVYYRSDLFEEEAARGRFEQKFGHALRPPATWREFDEVAGFFDGQDRDGDGVADRSVVVSSAADALVGRAAAYGKLPQNLSFYFDVRTFEPLVAGPAFQSAMEDWSRVAHCVAGDESPDPLLNSMAGGRAVLGVGSSALAARLLAADGESSGDGAHMNRRRVTIGCATLPANSRAYQHDKQSWIDFPAEKPNRAAVVQGVVASVLARSANPAASFDLLTFLTSRERSLAAVTTPGNRIGPYRLSHLIDPLAWTSAGWSSAGTPSFVSSLNASFTEPNAVAALRILGADEFMAVLDSRAAAVLRGESAPDDALHQTADSWRAIAERLGTDRLRRQYCYSLGMPVVK